MALICAGFRSSASKTGVGSGPAIAFGKTGACLQTDDFDLPTFLGFRLTLHASWFIASVYGAALYWRAPSHTMNGIAVYCGHDE